MAQRVQSRLTVKCPYPTHPDPDQADTCDGTFKLVLSGYVAAGREAPAEEPDIVSAEGPCEHVRWFNLGRLDDSKLWDAIGEKTYSDLAEEV